VRVTRLNLKYRSPSIVPTNPALIRCNLDEKPRDERELMSPSAENVYEFSR
jgi:hypothetical protein